MRRGVWKYGLAITGLAFVNLVLVPDRSSMAALLCVLLAWGVLPAAGAVRKRRRGKIRETRLSRNRCVHCGYSLRGLRVRVARASGVCPECGMPYS